MSNALRVVDTLQNQPTKWEKIKSYSSNTYLKVGTAVGGLMLGSSAMAADAPTAPDFTPIVTMITGLVAVVASVGMAVLTVYATAKVFKWVKTAF